MSFKLLTISFLYSGYLKSFYKKNPANKDLAYSEQLEKLLFETSEPIGAYTKMFNMHGISASCIITNAEYLQKKWRVENGFGSISNNLLVVEQIKKCKPDVLWIEGNEYIEKGWIDMVRSHVPSIRLFIGNHCAPYNEQMVEKFKNLDFMFTCTPGLKQDLEKSNLRVFLVYHAFDPQVLNKIKNDNSFAENDFIFSGSLYKGGGFHDKRIHLLENILLNNIELKIYANLEKKCKTRAKQLIYYIFKLLASLKMGKITSRLPALANLKEYSENLVPNNSKTLKKAVKPPFFGFDMFRLLKKSKIVLNIHGDVAGDYAGNVRLFEATGVGSCLLTDNKKNLTELFDVDKEIVAYEGIEDCIEKIKWLLTHDAERKRIAESGQQRTLSSHTVEERCKKIIEIINSELEIKLNIV